MQKRRLKTTGIVANLEADAAKGHSISSKGRIEKIDANKAVK